MLWKIGLECTNHCHNCELAIDANAKEMVVRKNELEFSGHFFFS